MGRKEAADLLKQTLDEKSGRREVVIAGGVGINEQTASAPPLQIADRGRWAPRGASFHGMVRAANRAEGILAYTKNLIPDEQRPFHGQSLPLGDTGDDSTGVPAGEQGISNRPGDQPDGMSVQEDQSSDKGEEDEDEAEIDDEALDDESDDDEEDDEDDEDEQTDPGSEPGKPV